MCLDSYWLKASGLRLEFSNKAIDHGGVVQKLFTASIRGKSAAAIQQSSRNVLLVHEDYDLNLATKLLTMEA